MAAQFVDQTIEIDATPGVVWQVLTSPAFTGLWVNAGWRQFLNTPASPLTSEWKLGSVVEWSKADGGVFVTGNVTALETERKLRFTVIDTSAPPLSGLSDEDGITFTLEPAGTGTRLNVRQGDFGKLEDGAKYHQMTETVWQRVLPKIKELAENSAAIKAATS